MSRHLEAEKIVETLDQLQRRVEERFPNAGLAGVATDLVDTARKTAKRIRAVNRPYFLLRLVVLAAAAAGIVGQGLLFQAVAFNPFGGGVDGWEVTQALESAVNLLILAGAAIWFLMGAEERLKRRRVFGYLHELRSFAHVVDMHQLTKDPTAILAGGPRTRSSPVRDMSRFELARYLDYCTEMLALIAKLAALYAEDMRDAEVIDAVNDIETLTTNLGRKIWQKIMIIGELDETANPV
ncbi:MAG: hypothetical protein AAGL49_04170 [Pseudomonadota bacterium]